MTNEIVNVNDAFKCCTDGLTGNASFFEPGQ
jgi:hypothetical protein